MRTDASGEALISKPILTFNSISLRRRERFRVGDEGLQQHVFVLHSAYPTPSVNTGFVCYIMTVAAGAVHAWAGEIAAI